MKENCIIILSHSSYQDIWEITLKSYKNYFPQTLDRYIISDENLSLETLKIVDDCGFQVLYYPSNISWSESVRFIFNTYIYKQYKSVIFSFDDLVLLQSIDRDSLMESLALMQEMDYLVLNDGHHNIYGVFHHLLSPRKKYFPVSSHDSYVGSLVFTAWSTQFFHKIINHPILEDVSPWQYEFLVSKLMHPNKEKGFYVLKKPLFNFANVVIKGKLFQPELEKVRIKNGDEYRGVRIFMEAEESKKFDRYRKFFKMMRYILPHFIFKKLRKSY